MVPVINASKISVHSCVHVLSTYSSKIIQKKCSINTVSFLSYRHLSKFIEIERYLSLNFSTSNCEIISAKLLKMSLIYYVYNLAEIISPDFKIGT